MTEFTNKNLEFLSNQQMIEVLQSVLRGVDATATAGEHRATVYLAMSALEGLFGDILRLKKLEPRLGYTPKKWPLDNDNNPRKLRWLSLEKRYEVLQANGDFLPPIFTSADFKKYIKFRNYIHPDSEVADFEPIELSDTQRALSYLNAVIEKYQSLRVAWNLEWEKVWGIAKVLDEQTVKTINPSNGYKSMLISELKALDIQELEFQVEIPSDGIFNFVYNYVSQSNFRAARIEGRPYVNGIGYDSGRLLVEDLYNWNIDGNYVEEPDRTQVTHKIHIDMSSQNIFTLTIDRKQHNLKGHAIWEFDPSKCIGFMTEQRSVSISNLKVKMRS